MCGINGIIKKNNLSDNRLTVMNNAIIHRGPDDHGVFYETFHKYNLSMGMRRLSIIDLSNGKQPMISSDGNIIIVFNGEIYNFLELKKDLIQNGITFITNSDTEVVLKMYEYWGVKSFSMLDGMFAFSIHDKKLNKLFIARDYFGEKPLYYTKSQDSFIWASELKSIINILPLKPNINITALNLYMLFTFIPAPYTIYDGIHKLEANHYIELDYNNLNFNIFEIEQKGNIYAPTSKSEAIKITHDLVQESVVSRSISDVPLGTFLSGGVDSSIISLCLAQQSSNKIDTFSIGFDKKSYDETDKSRIISKLINSHHHEFIISEKDLAANIDEIVLNFDEPFADSSALASYLVSAKAKEYVTVALTGDGGDEVFGGYNKYYMGQLNELYTKIIPSNLHKGFAKITSFLLHAKDDQRGNKLKFNRLIKAIDYEGDFYYNIVSLGFQGIEAKSILKSNCYSANPLSYYKAKIGNNHKTLTDFRNIDKLLSLEGDMLVKVDRTSMLSSLECRAPFLNKNIWNFTSQLPENYLINGWDKKHILKEAFKSYFPKDFLNKSKKGFGVPVGDWLRANLKNELLTYIDKAFIEKQNIFQFEMVYNLVNNHVHGKIDNTFQVWTFFCFQKWYRHTYEK